MTDTQTPQTSVEAILQRGARPMTVFTLSWCSYCHAVKSLLDSLRVPYQTVELDTGMYLDTHLHQRMRAELRQLSGSQTLPQVFVGRDNIGGYTETQAAARAGRLQALLAANGVAISTP
jgi:glutaredoxin